MMSCFSVAENGVDVISRVTAAMCRKANYLLHNFRCVKTKSYSCYTLPFPVWMFLRRLEKSGNCPRHATLELLHCVTGQHSGSLFNTNILTLYLAVLHRNGTLSFLWFCFFLHGLPSTHAYSAVGANLNIGCSFAKLYSTDDKVCAAFVCMRDIRLGHVMFQSHLKLQHNCSFYLL